jgi:hypothetical protein
MLLSLITFYDFAKACFYNNKEYKDKDSKYKLCDSSGGMSPVHVLLTCTRLSLSKRDTLASVLKAIKARPYIL